MFSFYSPEEENAKRCFQSRRFSLLVNGSHKKTDFLQVCSTLISYYFVFLVCIGFWNIYSLIAGSSVYKPIERANVAFDLRTAFAV